MVWQAGLDPDRLVFIDETWAKTNMTRPRGRSYQGHRLIAKTPLGHWMTTTFLAALRSHGLETEAPDNGQGVTCVVDAKTVRDS